MHLEGQTSIQLTNQISSTSSKMEAKTAFEKLPSEAKVIKELANKPKVPVAGAKEISKNVIGYSLIGLGVGAGIAIAPIAILGTLGAGVGLVIGNRIEVLTKEKDAGTKGAVVGALIGTLLIGAIIVAGGLLLKSAKATKKKRMQAAQTEIKQNDVKTAATEARIKTQTRNKVKTSLAFITKDYKSGDPEKVNSALNKIKNLSDKDLSTLLSIINDQSVDEADLSELGRSFDNDGLVNSNSSSHNSSIGSASVLLDALHDKLSNVSALSVIDATYETDGKGIEDIAYVNQALGFAYVVDGTGHGSELMAKGLNDILDGFTPEYENNRKGEELNRDFLLTNITNLEYDIHNYDQPVATETEYGGITKMNDGTLQPCMSFVQIMPGEGSNRTLLSAKYADTMFMVMNAKSSPEEKTTFNDYADNKPTHYGVGSADAAVKKRNGGDRLTETPVKVGDVVYLFSDGIGEFLTKDEIQAILTNNTYPDLLLSEFKSKIIAKGLEYKEAMSNPNLSQKEKDEIENSFKNTKPANGARIKYHDPLNKGLVDDLSLAILKVS